MPVPMVPPKKILKSDSARGGDAIPGPVPGPPIRPTSTPNKIGGASSSSAGPGPVPDSAAAAVPAAKSKSAAPPGLEAQQERFGWQVRKGNAKKKSKMYWGWVGEDLDRHLENMFQQGQGETTFLIDGWRYYYDLQAMTQTSPGEETTERKIRRVPYNNPPKD